MYMDHINSKTCELSNASDGDQTINRNVKQQNLTINVQYAHSANEQRTFSVNEKYKGPVSVVGNRQGREQCNERDIYNETPGCLDGKQCNTPNGKCNTPNWQCNATKGQCDTPNRQCNAPNGQCDTPNGQCNTPNFQCNIPNEQCDGPNGHCDTSNRYNSPGGECSNGWMIVCSAFLAVFVVDGITFSFGILLVVLIEEFSESTASVAVLGGMTMGCYSFAALLTGALVDVFGKRYLAIFGSFLCWLALFSSIFATSVKLLYFSYGVLGGFGFGFLMTTPLAALMEQFSSKRSLAGGVALSASGIGMFVMSFGSNLLFETYNWRGTCLILSGIMLNGVACGLALPQKKINRIGTTNAANHPENSAIRSAKSRLYNLWQINVVLFRDKQCCCILMSSFVFGLGGFVPFSFLPEQAVMLGMKKSKAAWFPSAIGIGSTLSQIVIGWLGSKSFANRKAILLVVLILTSASHPLSLVLTSFKTKLAYAAVYGALDGAVSVLIYVLLSDAAPPRHVDKTPGLVNTMYCLGIVIGTPLAGWTVDITGDFTVCFTLAGVEIFCAAIFFVLPSVRDYCSMKVFRTKTTHL